MESELRDLLIASVNRLESNTAALFTFVGSKPTMNELETLNNVVGRNNEMIGLINHYINSQSEEEG